ncbi:PadR family transcriptional regulator (plasmid) [Cellulomonas sp. WB94]|uniref:helix-turn-helix transcriptional regulator n=1 Tax=Cellulomonas sp. WB94 TaxID=2173174 RepID=UPI000D57EDEC|nr:helix-turn-helix transcriptional regulator [Cellulomonas sp. WB94]PVU84358.1 PadR family transcriptional regulator [Cellulomonas sp. WB94]
MPFSGSTTSYALLGLLRLRPWTTYELAKQVQRSLHWFWPRAERTLYDEPKLLVAAGLATATVEATGKRPRTVYAITDAGTDALARWLTEPPEPRGLEFAALVKVFFADAGTLTQLEGTLGRIEDESAQRVDALAAMARASLEEFAFPQRLHLSALTMRLQLEQELAVLRWARWARDETGEWDGADSPGRWDAEASLRELLTLVDAQQSRSEVPRTDGGGRVSARRAH